MNKKTLKAAAAIVISCVVMVVVVIYTPKPKKREALEEPLQRLEENRQRREKENAPFNLTLEALRKTIDAIKAINEAHELIHEEKADLNPLIKANLKAIAALTEASAGIKSGTDEIQRLNEEQIDLNPLIEANTALIEALIEVSETMQTLTEDLQRFAEDIQRLTGEKAYPWPPHEAIYKAVDKVLNAITLAAQDDYRTASNALHQYQDTRREHYLPKKDLDSEN